MHAILGTSELFCVFAFFAVVYLERVVVTGYNGELTRVVKVERGYRRVSVRRLEALRRGDQPSSQQASLERRLVLTLAGRKAVMTSLTFCVGCPAGGGGAPGVAAIVSVGLCYLLPTI
jgi:hypothetical protein